MKRVGFFTPLLAVLAILQGCSPSNPGVARLGNNQYILTRQAASGFHGLGAVKIDALREAENHCMVLGQTLLVTDTLDSPPRIYWATFKEQKLHLAVSSVRRSKARNAGPRRSMCQVFWARGRSQIITLSPSTI